MSFGILAGILWALETVTLGAALQMSPFVSTEQAVFLAPFVGTFLHDLFSALWMLLFNGVRGDLGQRRSGSRRVVFSAKVLKIGLCAALM